MMVWVIGGRSNRARSSLTSAMIGGDGRLRVSSTRTQIGLGAAAASVGRVETPAGICDRSKSQGKERRRTEPPHAARGHSRG
jgi:hypothetical protein